MSQILFIGSLRNGTKVEILGLADYYKDIEILHSNDCGCSIKGMHKIDGSYKPLGANFVISNCTPVRVLTSEELQKKEDIKEVKQDSSVADQLQMIQNLINSGIDLKGIVPDELINAIKEVPIEEKKQDTKSCDLIFPTGEFTMEELAKLNGITKANAYIKMKKSPYLFHEYEKPSVRGRPTKVYKKK
jgi:hypothetical protein